jgi:hypothetical protein
MKGQDRGSVPTFGGSIPALPCPALRGWLIRFAQRRKKEWRSRFRKRRDEEIIQTLFGR